MSMMGGEVPANVVLTADTSQYNQALQQSGDLTSSFGDKVAHVHQTIQGAFKTAGKISLGISAADATALTAATAAAARYQSEMRGLASQSNVLNQTYGNGRARMQAYTQATDQLRASFGATTGAASQLVQTISGFERNGTTDSLSKLASTFERMSRATGENASVLAQSVLSLDQTMQNSLGTAKSYADELTTMAAASNTTAASLANFASQIGPLGRLLNMTESQVIGFASAFSKAGQDGYRASNVFNQMVSDVGQAIQTNSPRLQQYAALMGTTVGHLKQMNGGQQIAGLMDAISAQKGNAIGALSALGYDGPNVQRIIAAVVQQNGGSIQGVLNQAAGARNNGASGVGQATLGDEFAKAGQSMEMAGESIGKVFIPAMTLLAHVMDIGARAVNIFANGPFGKLASVFAAIAVPVTAIAGVGLLASKVLIGAAGIISPLRSAAGQGLIEGLRGGGRLGSGMEGKRGAQYAETMMRASRVGTVDEEAGDLAALMQVQSHRGVAPAYDMGNRIGGFMRNVTAGRGAGGFTNFTRRSAAWTAENLINPQWDQVRFGNAYRRTPLMANLNPFHRGGGTVDEAALADSKAAYQKAMRTFASDLTMTADGFKLTREAAKAYTKANGDTDLALERLQTKYGAEGDAIAFLTTKLDALAVATAAATDAQRASGAANVAGAATIKATLADVGMTGAKGLGMTALLGAGMAGRGVWNGTRAIAGSTFGRVAIPLAATGIAASVLGNGTGTASPINSQMNDYTGLAEYINAVGGAQQTIGKGGLAPVQISKLLQAKSFGGMAGSGFKGAGDIVGDTLTLLTGGGNDWSNVGKDFSLTKGLGRQAATFAAMIGVDQDTVQSAIEKASKDKSNASMLTKIFAHMPEKTKQALAQQFNLGQNASGSQLSHAFTIQGQNQIQASNVYGQFGLNYNAVSNLESSNPLAFGNVLGQRASTGQLWNLLGGGLNPNTISAAMAYQNQQLQTRLPYESQLTQLFGMDKGPFAGGIRHDTNNLFSQMQGANAAVANAQATLGTAPASLLQAQSQATQNFTSALNSAMETIRSYNMQMDELKFSQHQFAQSMQWAAQQEQLTVSREKQAEGISVSRANLQNRISRRRATQDNTRQRQRAEMDFELQRTRAESDFQLQRGRAQSDFDLQRSRAQSDFDLQRSRAQQDHDHEMTQMIKSAAESMMNIYKQNQPQSVTSASYLLYNNAQQTAQLQRQEGQLSKLKGMGLSTDAIQQLGLTDAGNNQQLNSLFQQIAANPQLIDQLNQGVANRLAAAGALATDSASQSYQEGEYQFNLSLQRSATDFTTSMKRSGDDFNTQMSRSATDFATQMSRSLTDFDTQMGRSAIDFERSMKQSEADFDRQMKQQGADFARQMRQQQQDYLTQTAHSWTTFTQSMEEQTKQLNASMTPLQTTMSGLQQAANSGNTAVAAFAKGLQTMFDQYPDIKNLIEGKVAAPKPGQPGFIGPVPINSGKGGAATFPQPTVSAHSGWCLSDVENALGAPHEGATAYSDWLYNNRGHRHTGAAPAGTAIFFGPEHGNGDGHVAISAGGGLMWSEDSNDQWQLKPVWANPLGWTDSLNGKSLINNPPKGFSTGAWRINRDQGAIVHKGEMIIPAKMAEALRRAIDGGYGITGESVRNLSTVPAPVHVTHHDYSSASYDYSTEFSGPVSVVAQNPAELADQLKQQRRVAAMTGKGR